MFKENLLLTFYAQTPIHPGSGTSVSYVDLPVQREKHTDYPMIAASGIKGVIRDLASRKWDKEKVDVIFGPEDGSEYASCIAFTDAKILLFPVRSVKGVFAYITCPNVLKRFKRDLESIGITFNLSGDLNIEENKIIVCSNSELKIDENRVALEEFVFEIIGNQNCDDITNFLKQYIPCNLPVDFHKHFAMVSDNTFRDFTKYAVEIRTRIRIDQTTGTVSKGALFFMELIPSESVFYSLLFITDVRKSGYNDLKDAGGVKNELANILKDQIIQIGGDETLGMGLMKVKVYDPNSSTSNQAQEEGCQ